MKKTKIFLIVLTLLICATLFYKLSYEPSRFKSVCLSTAKSSYLVSNISKISEKQNTINYLYTNCLELNKDVPDFGNGIYYEANENLYPKFMLQKDSILTQVFRSLPFSTATSFFISIIFIFLFGLWLLISYRNNKKLGFKIFGILIISLIVLIILFILFLNIKTTYI